MQHRGIAEAQGLVQAVEVPGYGRAPELMDAAQIRIIEDFLFGESVAAPKRASRAKTAA
jgi:hypothetical protein